jgi:hypothetical protein
MRSFAKLPRSRRLAGWPSAKKSVGQHPKNPGSAVILPVALLLPKTKHGKYVLQSSNTQFYA